MARQVSELQLLKEDDMTTKQFTGTTRVWISSPKYKSMTELKQIAIIGEPNEAVDYVNYSNIDMSNSGWVDIGIASITVTLADTETVIAKQVGALQQELKNARAEAQMRENAILDQISKLTAINYMPA
jgi:hypothetical protein